MLMTDPTESEAAQPVRPDGLIYFGARVPESLRRRARLYAVQHDLELRQILEEAMEDWLRKHGA